MRTPGPTGSSRPASCRRPRRRRHRHRPRAPARARVRRPDRPTVTTPYLERLAARSAATGTVLCLGLDPDPAALPAGFSRDLAGAGAVRDPPGRGGRPVRRGDQAEPRVLRGLRLGRARRRSSGSVPALPDDLPVVADAKRGDIGSTAARQATALFDVLGADAVTVNPYLGSEAIAPLLERTDRFAYVLCRTSNPGAGELQDLVVAADPAIGAPAEPLHRRVARRAAGWGPGGTVGLVVGATAPDELAAIRAMAPGLAFLVPGVGAQGGEEGPVLEHGRATRRTGRGPGRRRAARERLARHRERRVGASGPARRRPVRARSRRPPPTGPGASLCYPSRRETAIHRSTTNDAYPRTARARHHPGHRAADPRPRQAAGRRCRARQEHPRVPQGVVGRPGSGEDRHLADGSRGLVGRDVPAPQTPAAPPAAQPAAAEPAADRHPSRAPRPLRRLRPRPIRPNPSGPPASPRPAGTDVRRLAPLRWPTPIP